MAEGLDKYGELSANDRAMMGSSEEDPLDKELDRLTGSDTAQMAMNLRGKADEMRHNIAVRLNSDFRRKSLDILVQEAQTLSQTAEQLDQEASSLKDPDGILRNKPETREILKKELTLQNQIHDLNSRFIQRLDALEDDEKQEDLVSGKMQ
jgi:hypothetical protein